MLSHACHERNPSANTYHLEGEVPLKAVLPSHLVMVAEEGALPQTRPRFCRGRGEAVEAEGRAKLAHLRNRKGRFLT